MNTTHLLAGFVGVLYPLYFLLTFKRTQQNIEQEDAYRLKDYQQTLVIFWLVTLLILANQWIGPQAGLNFYPAFNTIGIVLAVLILAIIFLQAKQSAVSTETAAQIKEKMGAIYYYLPKTRHELRWFTLLSISAGICEEIIFRLFFFTFLLDHVHLSLAFILTNLLFALTHIGSGKQNLINSFVLGLVFSAIYYFTENIWLCIVLHAAIDINAGFLGYKTHRLQATQEVNPVVV